MLTRLIANMGAAGPADAYPAEADNPEGYWEPAAVVREMEGLLAASDSAWFDFRPLDLAKIGDDARDAHRRRLTDALNASFPDGQRFVVKDPRLCRVVGFLRDALAPMVGETRVVLALRRVADVAASLRRRDDITFVYGGIMWAQHMMDAELATRDLPRRVVHYDDVLLDPFGVADDLATFMCGAAVPAGDDLPRLVRQDLRHQSGTDDIAAFGSHLGLALRGFQTALMRLTHSDDSASRSAIDAAWIPVRDTVQRIRPMLLAEFASLRLSGRHMPPEAPRPPSDARAFMEAMEEMQASYAYC